ncbi:MAG: hypothetical protein NT087_05810 [Deltaproteobacteria bacterium]|nr:hypothetical protein [Deltaproteobacteria bacterium]
MSDDEKFARALAVIEKIEVMPRVRAATAPVLGFHPHKKMAVFRLCYSRKDQQLAFCFDSGTCA